MTDARFMSRRFAPSTSLAGRSHHAGMKIGFLGAGKMARALAAGLINGDIAKAGDIACSSRSAESSRAFVDLLPGARWIGENGELFRSSDLVVLALKPQQMAEALPPLRDASAGRLVLSLAAGVTLSRLASWLAPSARLVRAMPNTPMQIGCGASVYAAGPGATEADLALVHRVLTAAGQAWRVDEAQIDAVTALSGSGPAYVFHFLDALIQAAVGLGLGEELARPLALQTLLGSARLAAQSGLAPLELAAQVKSPGGTTLAGCAVLEKDNALADLMACCLAAAKARAEELARGRNP
jgi:pyrroline-5-carboxylate reductase